MASASKSGLDPWGLRQWNSATLIPQEGLLRRCGKSLKKRKFIWSNSLPISRAQRHRWTFKAKIGQLSQGVLSRSLLDSTRIPQLTFWLHWARREPGVAKAQKREGSKPFLVLGTQFPNGWELDWSHRRSQLSSGTEAHWLCCGRLAPRSSFALPTAESKSMKS